MLAITRRTKISIAIAALLGGIAVPASAQDKVGFEISAQPLGKALNAFAAQAGINIYFNPEDVAGRVAPTVRADVTIEDALRKLLAGTSLGYRYLDKRTIALTAAKPHETGAVLRTAGDESFRLAALTRDDTAAARGSASQESQAAPSDSSTADLDQVQEIVIVAASANMSSQATKTATPLIEVPQSISVITRKEMDLRGVQDMPAAVRYVSGVQPSTEGLDSRGDDVFIRGFSASSFDSSQYFDGLRSSPGGQFTVLQYDAVNLERVEVLKGPSAVLYGAMAPGGLVNMVTKRPQSTAGGEVAVGGNSHGQYRGTVDLTGPLSDSGNVSYRLVGLYRDGGSQVDTVDLGRWLIAPTLSWQPTQNTSLTFISHFQKDFGGSTFQFLPVLGTLYRNPLGQLPTSAFLGEPSYNTFDREQYTIGYTLTQQITDHWQIRQNARYARVDTDFRAVVAGALQSDNRTLTRRFANARAGAKSRAIDTQSELKFRSGLVEHVLLAGVDYYSTSQTDRQLRGGADSIDIFDRVYTGLDDSSPLYTIEEDGSERQLGVYLQDQLAIGDLRIALGGRYDWAKTYDDYAFAGDHDVVNTRDEAFTWRAGATYLFDGGLAPYFSYSQSFDPTVGADRFGTPFEPTRGRQYEAGVKYQVTPESFAAVSVYDIVQSKLATADPICVGDPLCFDEVQIGEVRVRGVEIEVRAEPLPRLSIFGSVTRLWSKLTEDFYGNQGNRKQYAPEWMANLYVDYTIDAGPARGLGFGAGVRYNSDMYGDVENTYLQPSYTLLDMSLRYDLGAIAPTLEKTRVTLNGSNMTNKTSISHCRFGFCSYGLSREVTLNISHRW